MTPILPGIAAVLFILIAMYLMKRDTALGKRSWFYPALLSAAFLIFSLITVITEGPLGFWTEHAESLWGNQVWFDLLIAIGIGWFLMLPKAKEMGMRLPLWLLFIICTGCIGLLAMLSRWLYLQHNTQISN